MINCKNVFINIDKIELYLLNIDKKEVISFKRKDTYTHLKIYKNIIIIILELIFSVI